MDDRKCTLLANSYTLHFHLKMILKRMRMERVLSLGSFCGIERVKLFMNVHLSAT